ncbi:MAG TPA: hypothetical protein VNL91_06065 [Thermoanaerobaculia bacterium]|nr:hypothetical protein [Thermoanaerobaculia bacterium]
MKRNQVVAAAALALVLVASLATTACKTSGMAATTRGQVLRLDIVHPDNLPEAGEDNLDVIISNVGINNIRDVVVDVEIPPQLIVLNQTHDRGVTVTNAPGSNLYTYTFGNIQPAENSMLRFRVRTAFGTMTETGSVKATAYQRDLPGDKLVETAVIRLRK